MKWYKLKHTGFINPLWFNRVKHGEQVGTVILNDQIELDGVILHVLRDENIPILEVGSSVFVRCFNHFEFTTEWEKCEHEQLLRQKQAEEKELKRIRSNQRREEAERFNATLKVPAEWRVGIKHVLSGLTENSKGDGQNKRTVYHIYLLEELKDGRLKRRIGDFLCTTKSGSNGHFSSDLNDFEKEWFDGEDKPYEPKVTCKQCIKIASRWNK